MFDVLFYFFVWSISDRKLGMSFAKKVIKINFDETEIKKNDSMDLHITGNFLKYFMPETQFTFLLILLAILEEITCLADTLSWFHT